MGSACCTAARSKEPYCASDGWSMEPSRYDHHPHHYQQQENPRRIQSRWTRKSQVSKSTTEDVCMMPPNRSPFSSSTRSFRSNSSSGGGTVSSNQIQDAGDVNLTIFNNSPFSESLRRSRASFDDDYDGTVILHQDSSGFRSRAFSFQDSFLSGSSNSFGSMSQKALGSESTAYNNQAQTICYDGLSPSSFSKQNFQLESSSRVSSSEMEALRRRVRSNMDMAPASAREKAFTSKMPAFSDLMESSRAGSSRWPNVGSPDSYVSTGFEDINEGYIWNLGAICNQESECAPRPKAQKCGLCSKEISRKSPWSFSRFPGSKELPVVGILDCGHVYHAECLDHATPATNAHDPPCPKCEMLKRFHSKSPERIADAVKPGVGYSGPLSIKGKTSNRGNMSEDLSIYKSLQMSQYISEGSSRKGPMQSLVRNHDHKSFSAKSLLRKQFNFKGKLYKDSHGPKRPGYAARVSPENSTREDD